MTVPKKRFDSSKLNVSGCSDFGGGEIRSSRDAFFDWVSWDRPQFGPDLKVCPA